MKRVLPVFDRFRIAKPCPMKWEDMVGDATKRFCAVCNKHVHDLGAMTEAQARALVASGRACVQVKRSAAIAPAAAAAAGLVFALSAACSGAVPDDPSAEPTPPTVAAPAADPDGGEPVMLRGEMMIDEDNPTAY